MHPRRLSIFIFFACSKTVTPAYVPHDITINQTVRNLFGTPDAQGNFPAASTTAFSALCPTTLKAQVYIFEASALLISPGTATPLSSCPVNADGTFSCTGIDVKKDIFALFAVIADASGSSCLQPTIAAITPCSGANFAGSGTAPLNTTCSAAISDNVLDASDVASGALENFYAVPRVVFTGWQSQIAALDQANPPTVAFQPLSNTGVVLVLVTGANGLPASNALPYLPSACGTGGIDCRAYTVNLNQATSAFTVSPLTATSLTGGTGMWLAQMQELNAAGALVQIGVSESANVDTPDAFGDTDCTGAATVNCYEATPGVPFKSGTLLSLPAMVELNYTPSEGTEGSSAACQFSKALSGVAGIAVPKCP